MSEAQSPPSGTVLTCDGSLLAPMPLHSARPRPSVPRASKHNPPCLSTLDTASCSGTLREPLNERRRAASERSYYNNEEQMDRTDSLPCLSKWIAPQVTSPVTGRAYEKYTIIIRETAVMWKCDMEQIAAGRRQLSIDNPLRGSHNSLIYLDPQLWTLGSLHPRELQDDLWFKLLGKIYSCNYYCVIFFL